MHCHQISNEEKERMIQYRNMMLSNDIETVKLGISLADEEFGKYSLSEDSKSFHDIIKIRQGPYEHKENCCGIRFWLFYVTKNIDKFYYE